MGDNSKHLPVMHRCALGVLLMLSACGVVWDEGGQRHAIGFGMVSWPLPATATPQIATGVDVLGIAVLATQSTGGLIVGYGRERTVHLSRDTFLTLDCISCDLARANARSGTVKEASP